MNFKHTKKMANNLVRIARSIETIAEEISGEDREGKHQDWVNEP